MTKRLEFPREDLDEVIAPYNLREVLDVLCDNGYVEGYRLTADKVTITVPPGVEAEMIMDKFKKGLM